MDTQINSENSENEIWKSIRQLKQNLQSHKQQLQDKSYLKKSHLQNESTQQLDNQHILQQEKSDFEIKQMKREDQNTDTKNKKNNIKMKFNVGSKILQQQEQDSSLQLNEEWKQNQKKNNYQIKQQQIEEEQQFADFAQKTANTLQQTIKDLTLDQSINPQVFTDKLIALQQATNGLISNFNSERQYDQKNQNQKNSIQKIEYNNQQINENNSLKRYQQNEKDYQNQFDFNNFKKEDEQYQKQNFSQIQYDRKKESPIQNQILQYNDKIASPSQFRKSRNNSDILDKNQKFKKLSCNNSNILSESQNKIQKDVLIKKDQNTLGMDEFQNKIFIEEEQNSQFFLKKNISELNGHQEQQNEIKKLKSQILKQRKENQQNLKQLRLQIEEELQIKFKNQEKKLIQEFDSQKLELQQQIQAKEEELSDLQYLLQTTNRTTKNEGINEKEKEVQNKQQISYNEQYTQIYNEVSTQLTEFFKNKQQDIINEHIKLYQDMEQNYTNQISTLKNQLNQKTQQNEELKIQKKELQENLSKEIQQYKDQIKALNGEKKQQEIEISTLRKQRNNSSQVNYRQENKENCNIQNIPPLPTSQSQNFIKNNSLEKQEYSIKQPQQRDMTNFFFPKQENKQKISKKFQKNSSFDNLPPTKRILTRQRTSSTNSSMQQYSQQDRTNQSQNSSYLIQLHQQSSQSYFQHQSSVQYNTKTTQSQTSHEDNLYESNGSILKLFNQENYKSHQNQIAQKVIESNKHANNQSTILEKENSNTINIEQSKNYQDQIQQVFQFQKNQKLQNNKQYQKSNENLNLNKIFPKCEQNLSIQNIQENQVYQDLFNYPSQSDFSINFDLNNLQKLLQIKQSTQKKNNGQKQDLNIVTDTKSKNNNQNIDKLQSINLQTPQIDQNLIKNNLILQKEQDNNVFKDQVSQMTKGFR